MGRQRTESRESSPPGAGSSAATMDQPAAPSAPAIDKAEVFRRARQMGLRVVSDEIQGLRTVPIPPGMESAYAKLQAALADLREQAEAHDFARVLANTGPVLSGAARREAIEVLEDAELDLDIAACSFIKQVNAFGDACTKAAADLRQKALARAQDLVEGALRQLRQQFPAGNESELRALAAKTPGVAEAQAEATRWAGAPDVREYPDRFRRWELAFVSAFERWQRVFIGHPLEMKG